MNIVATKKKPGRVKTGPLTRDEDKPANGYFKRGGNSTRCDALYQEAIAADPETMRITSFHRALALDKLGVTKKGERDALEKAVAVDAICGPPP